VPVRGRHRPCVCDAFDHDVLYPMSTCGKVMANLTLYELAGCPYCAKVTDTLSALDLEYDSIMVPRAHGERTETAAGHRNHRAFAVCLD